MVIIVVAVNMTLEELIQEIKSGRFDKSYLPVGRYDAIQNSCGGRSYDYSHAHFGNPPEEINYSHNDGAYFGNPAPMEGLTCG